MHHPVRARLGLRVPTLPRRHIQLPAPGTRRAVVIGAGSFGAGVARADYVFLGVPSPGLEDVIASLDSRALSPRAAVVSLAKGLVPPHGTPPTVLLRRRFGASRTACIGGPAHAREMVSEGAALVAASSDPELAHSLANAFI